MATLTGPEKYSTKYTISYNAESTTRTISGLNSRWSTSESDLGPYPASVGLDAFYKNFLKFTDGVIGYVGWMTEREVKL